MKKLCINGMVLTQEKKVGVPRYVIELLNSLDKLNLSFDVEVLLPCHVDYHYKNLKKIIVNPKRYEEKKRFHRRLWQFVDLPMYVRTQDCVFLQPAFEYVFTRNDIVIIYDLQPEHFKGNYTLTGRPKIFDIVQNRLRRHAILDSKKLIAISKYVRQDIIDTYHVDEGKIGVVYCGWQHFLRVQSDDDVFEQFPQIEKHQYYFSLGSRYKHKNLDWVYSAARKTPDSMFVVTGYNDVSSYSWDSLTEAPENVLFTGYLNDSYVKTLMKYCKAFIQPSLSEGFGIPPLEALSVGAEIIVSNATCLPEIYGDTAHYIDPLDYDNIDLDKILSSATEKPDAVLKKYSWDHAAQNLVEIVEPVLTES